MNELQDLETSPKGVKNFRESTALTISPSLHCTGTNVQNIDSTEESSPAQKYKTEESVTKIIVPYVPKLNGVSTDHDKSFHELEGECIALKLDFANANSRTDYLNHELQITKNKNLALESELKQTKSQLKDMKENSQNLKARMKELLKIKSFLQSNVRESAVERSALMMNLKACQEQRDQYKEQAIAFGDYRVQSQNEKKDLMATIVAMQIELDRIKSEERKYQSKQSIDADGSSTVCDVSTGTPITVSLKDEDTSVGPPDNCEDSTNHHTKSAVSHDLHRWSLNTFGRRISILNDFMDSAQLDFDVDDELEKSLDDNPSNLKSNDHASIFSRKQNVKQKGARERVQQQMEQIEEKQNLSGSDSSGMSIGRRQQRGAVIKRQSTIEDLLKNSGRNISNFFRRNPQTGED